MLHLKKENIMKIMDYISKLVILVEGNPKAPFSTEM